MISTASVATSDRASRSSNIRSRPRGDSKTEVEEILSTIRLRVRQQKYDLAGDSETITLSMLVSERVRDLDESKSHQRRNRVVLESFRDHFPAHQRVDELTASDVLSFKRRRVGESKLKNNSINRELETVAAMFNAAGRYFPALASWKHPAMSYERTERRERVISYDEEDRLLAALRRERQPKEVRLAHVTREVVADLWELAPLVGMRRSEMRKLEKNWIDFNARVIQLPRHIVKTRRAREVPLNADALSILARQCARHTQSKFVFTNASGTNAVSEYAMYRALKKASKVAGVDYGRSIEGGFVLHDNRHTAVTRMLQDGHDLATVGDVVGHSKETMTLTYAHATLQSKRRAVDSLMKKVKDSVEDLTEETSEKAKVAQAE